MSKFFSIPDYVRGMSYRGRADELNQFVDFVCKSNGHVQKWHKAFEGTYLNGVKVVIDSDVPPHEIWFRQSDGRVQKFDLRTKQVTEPDDVTWIGSGERDDATD